MVAKRAAKKPVTKATSKRAAAKKPALMKSFRIYKEEKPFTRVQLSRQTLYWVILLAFIVVTQLWILKIQMDIASLTALLVNQ
ncbi:MAG: hypothetical protein JWN12_191 [Candidatus Saccharibacteria bacterium]|nr:hypothetical protein [Candidatus Saccharibacteria bacterium]